MTKYFKKNAGTIGCVIGGSLIMGIYLNSNMDDTWNTKYNSCKTHMMLHQNDNLWSLGHVHKKNHKIIFDETFHKTPCYIASNVQSYGFHDNTIIYRTYNGEYYGVGNNIPIEEEGGIKEVISDRPIKIELGERAKNHLIDTYNYTIFENNISKEIKYINNDTVTACNKLISIRESRIIPSVKIINQNNNHWVEYYDAQHPIHGPGNTIIIEELVEPSTVELYGIGIVDLGNLSKDIYSPLRHIPKYKYLYNRYIGQYVCQYV